MKHFTQHKICDLVRNFTLLWIGILLSVSIQSYGQTFSSVSITTVEVSNKKCDSFGWYVKFKVDNPGANGGWIIQEVDLKVKKDKCRPPRNILNIDKKYYEIWPVAAGANTSGTTGTAPGGGTYNDGFSISGLANTKGSGSWKGVVAYIANPAPGSSAIDTSTGGWGPGTVPYAGILISTYTQPGFWANLLASGKAKRHEMSISWDCCDPDNPVWEFDTLVAQLPKVVDKPVDEIDPDKVDSDDDKGTSTSTGRHKNAPSADHGINTNMYDLTNASEEGTQFDVYPNPMENDITIKSLINLETPVRVKLYNSSGKMVINQVLDIDNQATISVDQLPKGIYVLSIHKPNGQLIQAQKLLK
jgi:hypothetical protein